MEVHIQLIRPTVMSVPKIRIESNLQNQDLTLAQCPYFWRASTMGVSRYLSVLQDFRIGELVKTIARVIGFNGGLSYALSKLASLERRLLAVSRGAELGGEDSRNIVG